MKESSRRYYFIIPTLLGCLIYLLVCTPAIAQPGQLDSLQLKLKETGTDSNRLKLYINLCEQGDEKEINLYAEAALKLADQLIEKGRSFAEKNKLKILKGNLFYALAGYYEYKKDTLQELAFLDKRLALLSEVKNTPLEVKAMHDISNYYLELGNHLKAFQYIQHALDTARKYHDQKVIAECYTRIGNFYFRLGETEQAMVNYKKGLTLFIALKDSMQIANTLYTLSWVTWNANDFRSSVQNAQKSLSVYQSIKSANGIRSVRNLLGLAYMKLKKYDSAIAEFQVSLNLSKQWPEKSWIRGILGNIGDTYREQGNVAKALEYHYKALEVAKLTGSVSKVQMSFEYYRLAKDYFVAGNYANADHLLKKFLSVTKVSDFDIMGWLSDAKSMQVHIDSLTGNYKDAFQHYKEYILIREKQKSEDARKAAIREKYKNEYEEQKARDKSEQDKRDAIAASELQQQKFSRNAYAIGAILLLIISGILYNRNRLKHRNYIQLHEKNKIITEEKKRSDDLLLNILPMEVAEELKQTGGSVARQYNNVTVIFTDFVNFTSISQHLTPVELVEEIHRNFTAFDHIIEQHGLEKIKTIGDAYLAVCGLPIEKSDHALRAIQAAIEIRNYIAHQDTLFQIRIGVHSGNVVAGIVGVKKYAYDIWGDTVNTANRLESHSEAGKINISSSTYELIKNQYRCTYRGKVEAKGKGEIDMYYVEGKLEKTILSA